MIATTGTKKTADPQDTNMIQPTLEPFYTDKGITIYCGDCLKVMRALPAESVDSIVTDPPYGLKFMGAEWDHGVPSASVWAECLRVLKPGGHLLSFAGTRTQHRMACNIEDAGFEIRDMIAWVYGTGFPKSHNVSKAIDKAAGVEREVVGSKIGRPGVSADGANYGRGFSRGKEGRDDYPEPALDITAPATDEAKQWDGWGTALKPALEPITVARKPLIGTVVANVLEHGTGGINVDGCRVPWDAAGLAGDTNRRQSPRTDVTGGEFHSGGGDTGGYLGDKESPSGRFPANLIHDGSDEVVGTFPEGKDRFFYCAKANKRQRRGSSHPTVKPIDLMRYLVRLVTPLGAVVLDPFAGTGTTIEAAKLEQFQAIGIELDPEYCKDIECRLTM